MGNYEDVDRFLNAIKLKIPSKEKMIRRIIWSRRQRYIGFFLLE
jgi:hypothetical protein